MEHISFCNPLSLPPEEKTLYDQMPQINFFKVLGNIPMAFIPIRNAIQSIYDLELDKIKKEILILRVGFQAHSEYELFQHRQIAQASGMSLQDIEIILSEKKVISLNDEGNFLCQVADELEKQSSLQDNTFKKLNKDYNPHDSTAIILTASFYSMVCRFLNGTRIPIENSPQFKDKTDPFKNNTFS